jgi:two-component system, chemotaxis family, response regulator Rcp1
MSRNQGGSCLVQFQILLVDDAESDAQAFQESLKEVATRARAYWVTSGKEAIEFLHQRGRFEAVGTVQLVALDLHLPSEDGFSILRSIRGNPALSRTPVVMLSSSNS